MWIAPSLRIGIAVLAAFTLWVTPWSANSVKEVAVLDPVHAFTFRTQADAALTEWALARFQRAGLDLPPLTIAFHDDKQPCDGHIGFYRSGTLPRVDICGFNWNRFLMTPKKTILHELAHAWAQYILTDETRQRFLRFRGLTTWGDDNTPWVDQGSEQAAEIVAWALMDKELLLTIEDAGPGTLAQAYELLTSTQPPSWAWTPVTAMGSVSQEDGKVVW